ncbi:hypothetical protein [Azovibrio restrictus]|uniref:hypothetical protein n=1 Tax=Azovibrio restrictus TaxID=146938 RepID=UPI0026EE04AA|nr:hypothetical protein [Azovibrio restrictus]
MEKPPAVRGLSPFAGSRWLPLSVSLLLILVLMLVLLESLARAQAESERLMLEMTLRNINIGLQAAKGHALARGREHDIPAWAGQNPPALARWRTPGLPGGMSGRRAGPPTWSVVFRPGRGHAGLCHPQCGLCS